MIGLRPNSPSALEARAVGFTEADGTLGEVRCCLPACLFVGASH